MVGDERDRNNISFELLNVDSSYAYCVSGTKSVVVWLAISDVTM